MRVTDASSYNSVQKQLLKARKDVAVAQDQASTGLRVSKPSDDPVAAASARREASRKALADSGVKNAELATMQLDGADSALGDVFEGLSRARELAVQGASDTSGPENRRAAAMEVRKIREQMVSLGNTNVAGRYVFAGFRDQQAPFDSAGQFLGDSTTKEVQALPGLKVAASIDGATVFGSGSGDDVFAALDQLAQALESDDVTAIRGTLDGLEQSSSRIIDARSQVGALLDGVEMARSVADNHSYRAQLEVGRLTEVDEITAATNFLKAKSALEAALTVAQQIPTGGLVGGGK
jgi:flagellar hook-associated protein 3 FlgL